MAKKYGESVAQQLSNPSNYITRSQADAMGLGTERGVSPSSTPSAWRFIPPHDYLGVPTTDAVYKKMLQKSRVIEATTQLHNLSGVYDPFHARASTLGRYGSPADIMAHERKVEKAQKVIDDHYDALVNAPQRKALEEAKAREEEEQRRTIATLKMRVQELTKKPIAEPTAPAVTSSFPIIPIIIIAVIVGFFLLRRRA